MLRILSAALLATLILRGPLRAQVVPVPPETRLVPGDVIRLNIWR